MVGLRGVVLSAMLFWSVPAFATVMEALDVEALVGRSEAVAIVQVETVETVRTRGRLMRHVRAVVHEGLTGSKAGDRLVVIVPGGEDEDFIQRVPGAPDPEAGQLAVVFLQRSGSGAFHVTGLSQGWLVITNDPDDPTRQIATRAVDAHLLKNNPASEEVEPHPTVPTTQPLVPLLDRVRRAVKSR